MGEALVPAIVIPGKPVGKERPRMGRAGNFYTPRTTAEYEERVAWLVKASRGRVDGACEVFITVQCGGKRPDLDNIAKVVLDGMEKGGAFRNDRDVTRLEVRVVERAPEQVSVVWDAALPEAA